MPLVTTKKLFEDARKGHFAIGAFNVENAEMVRAVALAAQKQGAAVILQTTSSTLKYLNPDYFVGLAHAAEREFGVTMALHLDHGNSYQLTRRCIDAGYTSVMIDGSTLPFEENIALSAEVVNYARLFGICVEAELGTVGGKEDETESDGKQYTDPTQAAEFVARTGIDSLAIAFGTAHGFYKAAPVLDLDRILRVAEKTDVPLVMHGGSGLADCDVRQAVANGICKVNFATELRSAFTDGVREYLAAVPDELDPKKYLSAAMKKVEVLVRARMEVIGVCGSDRYRADRWT